MAVAPDRPRGPNEPRGPSLTSAFPPVRLPRRLPNLRAPTSIPSPTQRRQRRGRQAAAQIQGRVPPRGAGWSRRARLLHNFRELWAGSGSCSTARGELGWARPVPKAPPCHRPGPGAQAEPPKPALSQATPPTTLLLVKTPVTEPPPQARPGP